MAWDLTFEKLMRILAARDPILWELLDPHEIRQFRGEKRWAVASTPDPIPPVARVLALDVREAARAMAEAALGACALGNLDGARKMLHEDDLDWCGNSWPKRWPKPGPRGDGYLRESPAAAWPVVQATAALTFGAYAAAIDDADVSAMFTEAADQLANAALKGAAR